jgi:PAS domain S-box-containing protein
MLTLWHKLTAPHTQQEDDASREYIIKTILTFIGLITIPFHILAGVLYLSGIIPFDTVVILGVLTALTIFAWVMTHRGHYWLGGAIPCSILLIAGIFGNYVGGIDAPAMLLYALAIVVAAITLGMRAQMITLVISLIAYFGLGLAHYYGYLPTTRDASTMFINRVSIVFAALTAISLGVWFLKNQYQHSIDQVSAHAKTNRAVFETVTDGILFTDLSGIVLDMNDACANLFHIDSKEQVSGKSSRLFIMSDDLEIAREYFRKILSGNRNVLLNCRGKRIDGSEFFMEANGAIYRDSKGQPAGYVSAIRDITQRKQVEDELNKYREHLEELVAERTSKLDEAYRELESFSYSISHDLRAPLRRIEGFSRILIEEHAGQLSEEGLLHLNRIVDSAHRMADLIDDLLNFSRLIRQPLKLKHILPGEIVQVVVDELISGDYKEKNPGITIHEMPPCDADPILLRQVYYNLIDNALKYTSKNNRAVIEVGSQPGKNEQTVYYVLDNGIGFDMQYVGRIFGVFQRLHPDEEYEGTGIGLATVKRIVNRHGGEIWVESAVGQGTKFYFTLDQPQV